jgi:hypothetical protein
MESTSQHNNDYAIAHALNKSVMGIITMIVIADVVDIPEDTDISELNRAYILLIDELEKIYDNNPKLTATKPEPIWKRFDVLKTSTWEINAYLEDSENDMGQAHNARVEKLMILAGDETPNFNSEQQKLLDQTETIRKKYSKLLDELYAKWKANQANKWQIPSYKIIYKPDGSILINDVLKLKKVHAGSTTERLLEQALKRPNELFKPDLGQTARNISTVINGAGFTPILRQLFFPTVSMSKGIVFRPIITRDEADAEKLNTLELDLMLKNLGAITEPKN